MGLILDSSVVIAAERLGQTAYQMLEAIRIQADDPEIAISVVSVLELAHGIVRADTQMRRARRQQFLDDLLAGNAGSSCDHTDRSARRTNRRTDAGGRDARRPGGPADRSHCPRTGLRYGHGQYEALSVDSESDRTALLKEHKGARRG